MKNNKSKNNVAEKIEKIVKVDDDNLGYEIHTNKQIITCFIDNNSNCCETWGFLTTEDDLESYIGADLLSVKLVDMDYNSHPLTTNFDFDIDRCNDDEGEETSFCFIDINTSVGLLQFAIYNTHNGYYGHEINIKSNQLNYETDSQ